MGDCGHIGEELLLGIPEWKNKGFVVEKVIEEDYFTLEEALEAYQLSMEDYQKYLNFKKQEKI